MTSSRSLLPLIVVILHGTWSGPMGPTLAAGDAEASCYLVEVAANASVDELATQAAAVTRGLVVRKFTKLARGFAICLPAGADPARLRVDPGVVRVDADPGASVPRRPDASTDE